MSDIENKILSFLESGYGIDTILDNLGIDKESLADIIIELDIKGLINLEDKNWKLTQKGKDTLKEIKTLLGEIKIDYMYGNLDRDEFLKKKKELEDIIIVEKPKQDSVKEKNVICPKCRKNNKTGSKYCYKCGAPLDN